MEQITINIGINGHKIHFQKNGLDPEMLTSGSEYYLVNYETEEVIYSKGFKGEGSTTYYTLTEMQSYSN